jgi:Ca-activated chloride channel family protein
MLFQAASALWWLLPLVGAVLLLYLLKMRRRDVRVPATFLWPKLTSDVRANTPLQRLRISLLLLLQVLVLALLVMGLADPLRKAPGLHGKATVIVLDASASMMATDVKPSRFEAARRRIASVIATMSATDRLALIEAGPITRVLFPLSNDKGKMMAALRRLHPTDAPNDLGEALRLAAALVGQREAGRIVVFSDGASPPVHNFSPGKAEVIYESFGNSARNMAITAFEAADTPQGIQLFVGIRNYHQSRWKATLSFYVDAHVVDARHIEVPPRQTIGQTLQVSPSARRADVHLAAEGDLLQADNHASLFLQGAGTIRVLLVTAGNLFLERACALEPSVRLDRATALPDYERAGTPGEGRYELIVFDGVAPQPVKAPAVWSFGGISAELPVVDEGKGLSRPHVVHWEREHPLLRYTGEWDALLIEKGRKVRAKPEGRVLMTGAEGPLMVASERGGRRMLYVAWNLLDSDLPLRVSFPILVSNAISWLTDERKAEGGGLTVRAGQPFSVTSPEGNAHTFILEKPNGERMALDASSGVAVVRTADVVGDYTLLGSKWRMEVAVNLLNEAESDITPRSTLDLSGHAVTARGSAIVLAQMWRSLVVIALCLLAVEWWVFVRRS